VINQELTSGSVIEFQQVIDQAGPADMIAVVDQLVQLQIPMTELKKGINKALNLIHKSLQEFPYTHPGPNSFFYWMNKNNEEIDLRLKAIRVHLKQINQDPEDQSNRNELRDKFIDLSRVDLHYQIKENVLFPLIEKHLPDYRCLQVMWSFHDDIRQNLKGVIRMLESDHFDLKLFNRLAGDLFFNIYAIKFREERILFPIVTDVIPEGELKMLIGASHEIGFAFIQPEAVFEDKTLPEPILSREVDLKTGTLSAEQIRLIFNHLPVDITYVDENNKVKYFSTPEKRIFRRTNSIIGS